MDRVRRQKAIAEWNVAKNRAWAMNEQDRIPTRPLTGLSAREIETMTWVMNRALDRVSAEVSAWVDKEVAKAIGRMMSE